MAGGVYNHGLYSSLALARPMPSRELLAEVEHSFGPWRSHRSLENARLP